MGDIHDEKRLREFAKTIAPQDVQLWYQIGLLGRRDMPHAPNHRQALEMTLMRMLAFKPVGVTGQPQMVAAAAGQNTAPAAAPTPVASVPAVTSTAPVPTAAQSSASVATTTPAPRAKPPPPAATTTEAASEQPPAELLPPADLNWKPADWPEIVAGLPVSGMPLQLARNCVMASAKGDQVHLLLDPEYDTLGAPRWKERLREKMSVYAKGEIQLKVEVPKELTANTPAVVEKQAETDKLQGARDAIAGDPVVQEICEKFDGTVSTGSIKPVDPSAD